MIGRHALDEHDRPVAVFGAQREDLLVGSRAVSGVGPLKIGEFDIDLIAGPSVAERRLATA